MKYCGLVDLLEAANKNPKGASSLRPSIKLAVNCIVTGHTFKDLSRHAGVAHGTAWSYLTKAAPFVDPADFQRVGPNLVPRDVWKALHSLQSKGDERIGGPLIYSIIYSMAIYCIYIIYSIIYYIYMRVGAAAVGSNF